MDAARTTARIATPTTFFVFLSMRSRTRNARACRFFPASSAAPLLPRLPQPLLCHPDRSGQRSRRANVAHEAEGPRQDPNQTKNQSACTHPASPSGFLLRLLRYSFFFLPYSPARNTTVNGATASGFLYRFTTNLFPSFVTS